MRVLGHVRARTFRVLWLLEELGLPYEHVPALPHSPEVRAVNPAGRVPVLVTAEGAVTDSTAMLHHLSDRSGRWTHPAGSHARALQDGFTFEVLADVDAVLWTAAKHSFVLPEALRRREAKASLPAEIARADARLGGALEGRAFLAGHAPTVPDIILAHCAGWAGQAKMPFTHPAVLAHATRMTARPAFARVEAMAV